MICLSSSLSFFFLMMPSYVKSSVLPLNLLYIILTSVSFFNATNFLIFRTVFSFLLFFMAFDFAATLFLTWRSFPISSFSTSFFYTLFAAAFKSLSSFIFNLSCYFYLISLCFSNSLALFSSALASFSLSYSSFSLSFSNLLCSFASFINVSCFTFLPLEIPLLANWLRVFLWSSFL